MREAYNLLRQSIIHVELDDIDFDEEELGGERDRGDRRERQPVADGTDDVEMAAADGTDAVDESFNEAAGPSSPTRAGGLGAQLAPSPAPAHATTPAPEQAAQPKRKMKITHDRYQQLQNLVVFHLSDHEQRMGQGIDRDELIDWYLESREEELQTVEELEYEKELFQKVLRKLVKVCLLYYLLGECELKLGLQDNFLVEIKGDVQESLPTSMDENVPSQGETNLRVFYMVHPSVDTETSSSLS